jgi:hypothetical protein
VIIISQRNTLCENVRCKENLLSNLYNELGRKNTSHVLRETFLGKFSQVTDNKPGVIPVCLLKSY